MRVKMAASVDRRRRNRFRLRDVTRALRGAEAAGLPIGAVEVSQDGTIRILPKNTAEHAGSDNDLDAWIAKRQKDARPA
jgi:hypothetical protein